MKSFIPALALVAIVSLPALAQEAPAPGDMPHASTDVSMRPTQQQMAMFEKVRAQMTALHEQSRLQMLGSLSAAHREAVGNIIGQLAVSAHPNPQAAEAQIDALLSGNEKTSVLTAEANERNNSRAMMESVRAQMEASATPDEKTKMEARDAARQQHMSASSQNRPQMTPDAGRTLLHLASMHGDMGPGAGREFGHRPGHMM